MSVTVNSTVDNMSTLVEYYQITSNDIFQSVYQSVSIIVS